ncbi:MAG: metallophosphoesterase family protein [Verrucomicrobiae bacterium]
MKKGLAVLSDIHSNLEALSAVLKDLKAQKVEQIVCLGDIVGYASDPGECLQAIRKLGCQTLLGNHDEAACLPDPPQNLNDTAVAGIVFAAAQLTGSDRSWLLSLPRNLEIGGAAFTHASLAKPCGWHYILTGEAALSHFAEQPTPVAFCGHTHKPMVWIQDSSGGPLTQSPGAGVVALPQGGKALVNVGAVGQPRDGDPRASYVIYRPDRATVEFRRVGYDIPRTMKKILRANLPGFTAQRLAHGR